MLQDCNDIKQLEYLLKKCLLFYETDFEHDINKLTNMLIILAFYRSASRSFVRGIP